MTENEIIVCSETLALRSRFIYIHETREKNGTVLVKVPLDLEGPPCLPLSRCSPEQCILSLRFPTADAFAPFKKCVDDWNNNAMDNILRGEHVYELYTFYLRAVLNNDNDVTWLLCSKGNGFTFLLDNANAELSIMHWKDQGSQKKEHFPHF